MNYTAGSSFKREPIPGETILKDEIRKGDKINALSKDDSLAVKSVTFVARSDGDTIYFGEADYVFTLAARETRGTQYPTAIGAYIKFTYMVPAVLTNKGWQFVGKYSDTGHDYMTPLELHVKMGGQALEFKVLHNPGA